MNICVYYFMAGIFLFMIRSELRYKFYFLSLAFGVILFSSPSAYSNFFPDFDNEKTYIPGRIQHNIERILGHTNFKIVPFDLNGDGISEYIVKIDLCNNANSFCPYIIFQDTNNGIKSILSIKGRNLGVDTEITHRFYNILMFNAAQNDYSFKVYIWDRTRFKYILAE